MAAQKGQSEAFQVASVIAIPGYKIKDLLGRGGMATVYLAIQESVGREVALKVLAPDHTDETFSERFLREARIISRLSHPNIVTVFDAGIHQGHHYMSMEYIPGPTLRDSRDSLSQKEKLKLIKQVAEALDYAGKKGFVHRDIKPENIMQHEDGRAILTDFGIARGIDVTRGLTVAGQALGTPYYMSPEQAKGLQADPRSDIYSLGVVLFQILAGHVPYNGPSIVAIGIKHISEPIPQLPQGMERFQTIINTCLSKKPEHRYQTAGELIKALNSISDAEMDLIEAKAAAFRRAGKDLNVPTVNETAVPDKALKNALPKTSRASVLPKEKSPASPPTSPPTSPIDVTKTDEFKRLKRRTRFLFVLLLSTVVLFAYLRQDDFAGIWQVKIKPLVEKILPNDKKEKPIVSTQSVQPITTTTVGDGSETVQAEANHPAATATDLAEQDTKDTVTNIAPVVTGQLPIVEEIAPIESPEISTKFPQGAVDPLAAKQFRQRIRDLRAGMDEYPENAKELTKIYRTWLRQHPGAPKARQGLMELRKWYGQQIYTAIENNEIQHARLMFAQVGENFPRAKNSEQFRFLEKKLVRAEEIQLHLERANDHFNAGTLVKPVGSNALKELRAVLIIDPDNIKAKNFIQDISDKFAKQARQQKAAGKLHKALASVGSGLKAAKDNATLLTLQKKLQFLIKHQQHIAALLKQAKKQFSAGKLIQPKGESAYDLYQVILAEEPKNIAAKKGLNQIEQQLITESTAAIKKGDFDRAEKTLQSAQEHYRNSGKVAAARKELAQAIEATLPKVTRILFDDIQLYSLAQTQAKKIQPERTLYIGFSYKNFSESTTLLQANLLDGSGRVQIAQKPIVVSGAKGEHFFNIELPIDGFAEGTYQLELKLDGKRLVQSSFRVVSNLLGDN